MQWNNFLQALHVKTIKQIWQLYVFICLLLLPPPPLFDWPLLPTQCGGYGGYCFATSHSMTHTGQRSPGRAIDPSQKTSTWQHTILTRDTTSMPPVEFEPSISASEQPRTHALDGAATGTGHLSCVSKAYFTISPLWLLSLAWNACECKCCKVHCFLRSTYTSRISAENSKENTTVAFVQL